MTTPRATPEPRRQEEAWWAVASSTGKGWYKVVTVDGMPATCNCKGWIFRRHCRHLVELAARLGTQVAPSNRTPVTQGSYESGVKATVIRPSETTERLVADLHAAALALGWTMHSAPQAWGAVVVAGTRGPNFAFTGVINTDGSWGGGGYRTPDGTGKLTLDEVPRFIAHLAGVNV